MPQMAPISWLILFFIFSSAFIMFNILNYYCLPNNSNNNNNNNKNLLTNLDNTTNNNSNNWKW